MFGTMSCTTCGATIEPDLTLAGRTAKAFETCIYRCECGTGFSNARDPKARRRVMRSPELNVPAEVRAGLDQAMRGAVNEGNRDGKRAAFCSESSEDAVTWTVFSYLATSGKLARLLQETPEGAAPDLLLWGHPMIGDTAERLAEQLAEVSEAIGERSDRRSEPDVIAAWPDRLVFVEAKLTSANDAQYAARKFERYWSDEGFRQPCDEVARLGYYELIRNWRIGIDLAATAGRPGFALINLGPSALSSDLERLRPQLATSPDRALAHMTWNDLLHPADPTWLHDFAAERGLRQ